MALAYHPFTDIAAGRERNRGGQAWVLDGGSFSDWDSPWRIRNYEIMRSHSPRRSAHGNSDWHAAIPNLLGGNPCGVIPAPTSFVDDAHKDAQVAKDLRSGNRHA
jgi:hypothetical protein